MTDMGHGHGQHGQQPGKDLCSPKFLNLLQLAMSLHKLYLCRGCVAGKKKKRGRSAVPRYGQWAWGRMWWNLPASRGSVGCKRELCNAYNPTYFSLFYFKTLNSFVGSLHLGNSVQWNSSWMLETRKNSLIVEMALPSWKQWEESTQGVSLTEGQARYLSCQALTTCCF